MRRLLLCTTWLLGCNHATGLDVGGNQAAVCAAGPGTTDLAQGSWRILAVAVDDDEVFFVDEIGDTSALRKIAKKGGATTTLVQDFNVGGHVLALLGNDVWWPFSASVFYAPKTGGPAVEALREEAIVGDLVASGDALYFVVGSDLLRMYPDGGPTVLSRAEGKAIMRLGVDGEHTYWIDCQFSSASCTVGVRRAPITGGAPGDLTSYQGSSTTALSVDAANIYWVVNGVDAQTGAYTNTLMRMPKSGGTPQALGTSDGLVSELVGDERNLYFIATGDRKGTLRRMSKSDGARADLTSATAGLALDDGCVYFADGARLRAMSK